MNKIRKGLFGYLESMIMIILIIILWCITVKYGNINAILLPSPQMIVSTFLKTSQKFLSN